MGLSYRWKRSQETETSTARCRGYHRANSRHDDTDSCGLLCDSVLRFRGDPPTAEERFHGLSVLGAHAVVDDDVEGAVDVGSYLQQPGHRLVGVLVASPRVHLRHKQLHEPANKE